MEKNNEILERALRKYGSSAQKIMLMEECAELMNEIAKTFRGRSSKENVISELADVSIMIEQMAYYFGKKEFEEERLRKIERLRMRLDS